MVHHPIPYAFARSHGVLLVGHDERTARILLRRGASVGVLAEIQRVLGFSLEVDEVDVEAFDRQLAADYSDGTQAAAQLAEGIEQDLDLARLLQDVPQTLELLDTHDDAPIIRMINALLTEALRENASDIHIEAYAERSVVRFRVDGVMREVVSLPRAVHAALASRIKVMSNLDIAEKRLPQDGRMALRLAGRSVDVRVSTLPTAQGERAVLRLLDKASTGLDLPKLGIAPETLDQLMRLINQPHGLVLVTGPTGSGKTTTLYAALGRLDTAQLNIMTVEDPIEYEIPGIGQTHVNARIDMTFARALRSILRQDPDVVMIGEIRDIETAQIAVQASLTGHLVFATLHTNDAASAVTRLTDMGVEPFLLASSMLGVMAQRLVRRLCPACRVPDIAGKELLRRNGLPELDTYAATGCAECAHTGYRGRVGLYELLIVNDELRSLIQNNAGDSAYRDQGVRNGMTPLRSDGLRLIADGTTSVSELLRLTRD
ncbi:MAG: type II secretion system ATPase GspE [Rhodocyclaceae bacterium]|jgi:general secretion pathway protein E|nr:type II secretion system ATPase GspE [Rhodocyclaceae bacterium]MBK6907300.1 type II secretion system ATPase GspE [Rhodocyclaceae bacterium]